MLELIIIDIMTLYTSGMWAIISIVFLAASLFAALLLFPLPISDPCNSYNMQVH
jgi:hypothetical protein